MNRHQRRAAKAIPVRRPVNAALGSELIDRLADELPSYALKHLDSGLTGDVDAGEALVFAAPNEFRGIIAIAAYLSGVPNPGYQTIVNNVWNHDHQYLMYAAEDWDVCVRSVIAAAKFDVGHLPDSFSIWRGTGGCPITEAARGLSWTTDRDTACWFAFRSYQNPVVVLRATISRDDVIFASIYESEIIPRADVSAIVDGSEPDWLEGWERHCAAMGRNAEAIARWKPSAATRRW
jgi:hypothetical protein